MEIVRADDMGFCFGVRRAVEMMEQAANRLGRMTSLGSIVHNQQVVERLARLGVEVIGAPGETGDRPIAITSHGVAPQGRAPEVRGLRSPWLPVPMLPSQARLLAVTR